ncbi:AT-hook motif nuclear-localized protein [Heracleum sosnowskyi]|uniref:AT-hook motif nuclear-localized protein n=1 Tax=Heracleum sosnowskyi TaxID=360622 RepID=A0AAD8N311_9APIA|nr:AT-hook motif nuclear-localized protein [Heracleum sosnowskyi]
MKGEEYTEEKHPSNTTQMFSKIHQTQKFQPHHLHPPTPPPPYHPTPVHVTNFNLDPNNPTSTSSPKTEPSQNDGASIEVIRRPRGRPPGSKNKPKSPVVITRESEPSMSPYVLEIPAGSDIIHTITSFCRRRNSGLCILNGSGMVTNVTLKQPSTNPGATVTFHGRLDMLSISATILPNLANNFTITLAGPQGQIVGGAAVGPLVAASTVYVIAASFNSPAYHRLPLEDEQENNDTNGGGGADVASPSGVSGGGDSGHAIYSGHGLATDVIWAPTPRQPSASYQ